MKVKIDGVQIVRIKNEYIKLDSLLKYSSIATTGGEAKIMIQNGDVYVGKTICISRGKKIRPGDLVRVGDIVILVKQEQK